MRSNLSFAIALVGVVAAACSSSSGVTVKDQAGRTCTVPDTGSLTISCDQTPSPTGGCSGGATACFVLGDAPSGSTAVIGPRAVCAACCSGNNSTSNGGDCSPIVCQTLADCPHGSTSCDNGGCH